MMQNADGTVISEIITNGAFNTIEEADIFADKFIEKLPQKDKHYYRVSYSIKNEQIFVKIKRSDFRYGVSLVKRTCSRCHHGFVEYVDFSRINEHLSRGEREQKWLDPKTKILCFFCIKHGE